MLVFVVVLVIFSIFDVGIFMDDKEVIHGASDQALTPSSGQLQPFSVERLWIDDVYRAFRIGVGIRVVISMFIRVIFLNVLIIICTA